LEVASDTVPLRRVVGLDWPNSDLDQIFYLNSDPNMYLNQAKTELLQIFFPKIFKNKN
jgi:hypothetical protein